MVIVRSECQNPLMAGLNVFAEGVDGIAASVLRVRRKRSVAFSEGWGDPRAFGLLTDTLTAADPIDPIELYWDTVRAPANWRGDVAISRAEFASPAAAMLPDESQVVVVERVSPLSSTKGVVLLLPSWNDEGFKRRRRLAHALATAGIETLMLEAAHYGSRRSAPSGGQAIRTVAAFAQLGHATLVEARSILAAIDHPRRGIAGFSMGGNIAAITSATVPFPVAVTAYAASHSPGPVFLEGAISKIVDWDALRPQPYVRLASLFNQASALRLPVLDHHATAVILAAAGDGFVPPSATRALHQHWPGSSLQILPGGHAEFMIRHRKSVSAAIEESFARTFLSDKGYQSVGL